MMLDDPVENRAHQLVALCLRHRVQRRDRDLADGRLDLPPFDRLVADARDDCRELARNRRGRRRLGLVFTGRGCARTRPRQRSGERLRASETASRTSGFAALDRDSPLHAGAAHLEEVQAGLGVDEEGARGRFLHVILQAGGKGDETFRLGPDVNVQHAAAIELRRAPRHPEHAIRRRELVGGRRACLARPLLQHDPLGRLILHRVQVGEFNE